MKKHFIPALFAILLTSSCCTPSSQDTSLILPVPSTTPSTAQQQQIARKYGMFIHFGINLSTMKNGPTVPNRRLRMLLRLSMQNSGYRQPRMPV